jgi:hypothetical protein
MAKHYVSVTVKLEIDTGDSDEEQVGHIVNECDYSFTSTVKGTEILETEITDFEVI